MKLEDRTVVITGAGSGIGEACAHRFSAEGARVVLADVDAEGVDRVARAVGGVSLAVDLTTEEGVAELAELAMRTHGQIDLWFSNAGVSGPNQRGNVQETALWDSFWRLHVLAHVHAARLVLPAMLERGEGYLLQTASLVALATLPDKAAYAVTKHAALAFSEWLAVNFRSKGIKVSCFCPGAMRTPMLLGDLPEDHPMVQAAMAPEQVADLLVEGIDAERFLIVDSTIGTDSLLGKATDYDGWIDGIASLMAASE